MLNVFWVHQSLIVLFTLEVLNVVFLSVGSLIEFGVRVAAVICAQCNM